MCEALLGENSLTSPLKPECQSVVPVTYMPVYGPCNLHASLVPVTCMLVCGPREPYASLWSP